MRGRRKDHPAVIRTRMGWSRARRGKTRLDGPSAEKTHGKSRRRSREASWSRPGGWGIKSEKGTKARAKQPWFRSRKCRTLAKEGRKKRGEGKKVAISEEKRKTTAKKPCKAKARGAKTENQGRWTGGGGVQEP